MGLLLAACLIVVLVGVGIANASNVNSERSYIRLTFQNGKVVSKVQKGLENI